MWGGSKINIYNDRLKYIKNIQVSFKNPTCCCFGGNELNKLFITSAVCGGGGLGYLELRDMDVCGIKESRVIL